jgi:hypothetical protein
MEVAADLVVTIADALGGDAARGEEETSSLYRSRREDEMLGLKAEGLATQGANEGGGDAGARGSEQEFGDLGIEVDLHARVMEELATEGDGEVALAEGDPFGEARVDAGELGKERGLRCSDGGEEGVCGSGEMACAEEVFGLGNEGCELLRGDGPGGVVGEGEELATPSQGCASEDAEAGLVGCVGELARTDGFAAGFEEYDVEVAGAEAMGEDDARDAGADDADGGPDGIGAGFGELEIDLDRGLF